MNTSWAETALGNLKATAFTQQYIVFGDTYIGEYQFGMANGRIVVA